MTNSIINSENEITLKMNQSADKIMFGFLSLYAVFGVAISIFYDTWIIGIAIGTLAIISWFVTKLIFPNHSLHRYTASGFLGVFVGSYIYQMHGLFEMHFFAFIGSAILIVYQNWKLQIPLIAVVVVHHATFAYLQYSGIPDIYFTQLQYMDLQTFIFHTGLAATVVIICGYWAYRFRNMTILEALRSKEISENMDQMKLLNAKLQKLSQVLKQKNISIEERNRELEDSKEKLMAITEKQTILYKQLLDGKMLG